MAITSSFKEATGVAQKKTGRYLDSAGSPAATTVRLGFYPRRFKWINLTDRISWEWIEGMASGTTLKTAANGDQTLDTGDAAIQPDAGSGNQSGTPGTADTTNAGVVNNVAYPGPSTVINDTRTAIPGVAPSGSVVIAAAAILQNKQYEWFAE